MKKRILKVLSIGILIVFMCSICFASDDSELEKSVIENIASTVISFLMWFGLVIAFGMIFFIAIKYMMSGANEKANLKNIFPNYFLGIILIVCSLAIATLVVNIAGNENASKIIEKGEEAGEFATGQSQSNTDEDNIPDVESVGRTNPKTGFNLWNNFKK